MRSIFTDLIKKAYENIWCKTIGCIIFCLLFYFVRQNITPSENTLVIINFCTIGAFLLMLSQIISKKYFPLIRIILLLAFSFIMNKLYVPTSFYELFHIELDTACLLIILIVLLYLFIPVLFKGLISIIKFITPLIKECKEIDFHKRQEKEQHRKERALQREKNKIEILNKLQLKKLETAQIKEQQDTIAVTISSEPKNSSSENNAKWKDKVLSTFVYLFLLIVPFAFFAFLFINKDLSMKLENVDMANLINTLVGWVSLIIFGIFIWAIIVSVFFKLVHMMHHMILNKEDGKYYILYAGAFLLVSFFFAQNSNYTLDAFIDDLVAGDIFSYPLALVILLPVFLTLLDSLRTSFADLKNKNEIINLIQNIALGTIKSLLKYINFVTTDFLTSIAEITEGDIENDNERNNFQNSNASSEQQEDI